MKLKNKKQYVIGVDGGATKTTVALADLNGKIIKSANAGSSSLRNFGIDKTLKNVVEGIKKVMPKQKKEVLSIFIGLPDVAEEYKKRIKEIENAISKKLGFRGKLKVASDQAVAFRSGTSEKNGIVLIAGTGSVAHGWKNGEETVASGWGWLAEKGCAFWIGKRVLEEAFEKLYENNDFTGASKLANKIYKANFLEIVSSLAETADENILTEAGLEAAKTARMAIKKLNFKDEFSLILVGSMFKSEDFRKAVEEDIRKIAGQAKLIYPENLPVSGAIKLALEEISINLK